MTGSFTLTPDKTFSQFYIISNVLGSIQWPSSVTCHTGSSTTAQELYSTGGRDKKVAEQIIQFYFIVFCSSLLVLYVLFCAFYLCNSVFATLPPHFLFPPLSLLYLFLCTQDSKNTIARIIPTIDLMQKLKAKTPA